MIIRNVTEAKAELSKLVTLVEQGEEVVISRAGKPIVKLTLIKQLDRPRKLGVLKDQWTLPRDFDSISKSIDKEIEELLNK